MAKLPSDTSCDFSGSPYYSKEVLTDTTSLSSSISRRVVSQGTSVLFPSGGVYSMQRDPVPSTPDSHTFATSYNMSTFMQAFVILCLSTRPVVLPGSPTVITSAIKVVPS